MFSAPGFAIDAKGWIELKSDHFWLFTDLDENEARSRLQKLESFHSVVVALTGIKPPERVIPTVAVIFKSTRDFRQTAPDGTVGFYASGLRRNYMVLPTKARGMGENYVLFHEYIHDLLRAGGIKNPPWYEEGLADFLSTIEVLDDLVVIGKDHPPRLKRLYAGDIFMSLEDLVSTESLVGMNGYLVSFFYSYAWATTYFINMGHLSGYPAYGDKMPAYLQQVRDGMPLEQAFEQAFGVETLTMKEQMDDFLRQKTRAVLSIPAERFAYKGPVEVRPVPIAEAEYRLGYGLLRVNSKESRKHFDRLRKLTPDDARAIAGAAMVEQQEENWQTAFKLMAPVLEVRDFLVQLEYANLSLAFYEAQACQDQALGTCEQYLEKAIKHFRIAHELAPKNPEVMYGFAKSLSMAEQDLVDAAYYISQTYAEIPQSPLVNYWFGRILKQNQHDSARKYLERARDWTHDDELREKAHGEIEALGEDLAVTVVE